MQIIALICAILISLFGFLYAYRTVYMIVGLFRTKGFAPTEKFHDYAVIISARNEEAVLGNLLASIEKQNYPKEKITVFVVADNCEDGTATVARAHGAHCYERFDKEHQTKGYALQFLFEKIEKDFGIERFEGYFIFDADNLLKRDYTRRMNEAFDAGEKIITSYRNTKNLGTGCISAGYALHWLRTARLESRARSFLGLSTWVQGCGFLFASELVKDGWQYVTLAEDRAFSIDAVRNGYRISYQHEAEFYDEQPTRMKIVMRQRIRWAKGHLEAFRDYGRSLFCSIFSQKGFRAKWNCYDMFMTTIPYSILLIPIKLLSFFAVAALTLRTSTLGAEWFNLLLEAAETLIFEHFGVIPMALLLFITEHRRIVKVGIPRAILYSLAFPLFSIVGDIATWIAVFRRVTWQPIPHDAVIKIEEIENKI